MVTGAARFGAARPVPIVASKERATGAVPERRAAPGETVVSGWRGPSPSFGGKPCRLLVRDDFRYVLVLDGIRHFVQRFD